ncbi:MAG: hypothetical protein WCA84_12325 [Ignavibacteriaceae bacterium]
MINFLQYINILNNFLHKDELEILPISFYVGPEDTRPGEKILNEFITRYKIQVLGLTFIMPTYPDENEKPDSNQPSGRIFGIQKYTFLTPPANLKEFYKKYASAYFQERNL